MKKIYFLLLSVLTISCDFNLDYERAVEYYENGQFKEALEKLNQINDSDPEILKKKNKLIIDINNKIDSINRYIITEYSNKIDSKLLQINSNTIEDISFYKSIEILKNDSLNNSVDSINKKYTKLVLLANKSKKQNILKFKKEYVKKLKNKLWRNNIEVFTSNNNNYINFTGGIFASNANIEDFFNEIEYDLKEYGFKQANFRWYKNADEYTYFKIK